MSASSKKKLRNAQEAEKLTEKQLTEQKEAKNLKTYSTIFVVVVALMVVFAVYTAVSNTISHSGIFERNTTALTVGEHKVSNAELNYYFIDAVNNFYSNYGAYASLFGLDVTKPLDEQVISEETGTWADDFLNSAIENVKAVYALNDAAKAAGFTLTEDEQSSISMTMTNMSAYATLYGYSNVDDYIKAMYGNGANAESLREYITMNTIASSYQNFYAENLTYEDADLRAAEAENYNLYSSYSYNTYYLATSKFLKGGIEAEDGSVTYSDAEKEIARQSAEMTAKALTENTTAADLDAAIAALEINAETSSAASTAYVDASYSNISSTLLEWITDDSRQAGDITYIASTTHTHADGETHSDDEDTSAYDTVNGYYVVLFNGCNDNNYALANVRHILIGFEGGTTDETTGVTTYSEAEKLTAKNAAEVILEAFLEGEKTEEAFAELATKNTDDTGSQTTGGLYENVYPGQMVTNFNDWCFDSARKAGDTGIVETEYGYHVMYFVGNSGTTYRDYMIESTLRNADLTAWETALIEGAELAIVNTKYVKTGLTLSSN